MAFCTACGIELAENARFCSHCGVQRLSANASEEQPVEANGATSDRSFADEVMKLVFLVVLIGVGVGALIYFLPRYDAGQPQIANVEAETAENAHLSAIYAVENAANAAEREAEEISARIRSSRPEKVVMCYKDYCPCQGEQGGPDMLYCDRLEAGLPVDTEQMIIGRTMREARRQLAEGDY